MNLWSSHAAFDLVLAAHETVYKSIVVALVWSKGSVLVQICAVTLLDLCLFTIVPFDALQ
jgi:hypothetical protein